MSGVEFQKFQDGPKRPPPLARYTIAVLRRRGGFYGNIVCTPIKRSARPNISEVLRFDDAEGRTAFGKHLRGENVRQRYQQEVAGTAHASVFFADQTHFEASAAIASSPWRGMIVTHAVRGIEGSTKLRQLGPRKRAAFLTQIGQALALLHRKALAKTAPFNMDHRLEFLKSPAQIERAGPLRKTFLAVLDAAIARHASLDNVQARRGWTHGDCNPHNILWTPDGLGVIDFEQSHVGYQSRDIAAILLRASMASILATGGGSALFASDSAAFSAGYGA